MIKFIHSNYLKSYYFSFYKNYEVFYLNFLYASLELLGLNIKHFANSTV
jgi:hypothetical protein